MVFNTRVCRLEDDWPIENMPTDVTLCMVLLDVDASPKHPFANVPIPPSHIYYNNARVSVYKISSNNTSIPKKKKKNNENRSLTYTFEK